MSSRLLGNSTSVTVDSRGGQGVHVRMSLQLGASFRSASAQSPTWAAVNISLGSPGEIWVDRKEALQ